MLLHKNIVVALIDARLKSLDRTAEDDAAVADDTVRSAIQNEFLSLRAAIDAVPQVEISEGTALQKIDPMETAQDMIALRMRQLLEGTEPHRFAQVERLARLTQTVRREAGDRVADFEEGQPMDEHCGPAMGRPRYRGGFGHVNPNPRIGAPYGMGEDPAGPPERQYDVNDLYREVIAAIQPLADSRVAESTAGVRRDQARELADLIKIRKQLEGQDAERASARIQILLDSLDGAPAPDAEPILQKPPSRPRGTEERDPQCEHCQGLPPMLLGGRRIHVVDGEPVDCRTARAEEPADPAVEDGAEEPVGEDDPEAGTVDTGWCG